MSKIQASVGILTFNSGKTLRRALESVRDFDDIVLCDGGSKDQTLSIAEEFGARVIRQEAQFLREDGRIKDYSGVRNQSLDAARHDWFLYIDSDETISEGLREEIRDVLASGTSHMAFKVPIQLIIDGKKILHSSHYPGYQYRFFNRNSGTRFIKPVHERVNIDPEKVSVGTFKNPWHTHTTAEYWRHFIRHSAYYRPMEVDLFQNATWGAFVRFVLWRNVRTSLGVIFKATRNYLRHGFKDSMPIAGEWARIWIPLLLVRDILLRKLKRRCKL